MLHSKKNALDCARKERNVVLKRLRKQENHSLGMKRAVKISDETITISISLRLFSHYLLVFNFKYTVYPNSKQNLINVTHFIIV